MRFILKTNALESESNILSERLFQFDASIVSSGKIPLHWYG
jgi:hypothetical protein